MKYIFVISLVHAYSLLAAQIQFTENDLGFRNINDCNCDWIATQANCAIQKLDKGIRIRYQSNSRSNGPMEYVLTKHVILPEIQYTALKVELIVRNNSDSSVEFSLVCIDENEKVSFEKTAFIAKSAKWLTIPIKDEATRAKAINVIIRYHGDANSLQSVELRRINITLDDQDLSEVLSSNKKMQSFKLQPNKLIAIKPEQKVKIKEYIPNVKRLKIIGMGESTHGSKNIVEERFEFVKDLVQHHRCTMVLLEIPFHDVLLYDLYVQGLIDDSALIVGYLKRTFAGYTSYLNMLNWLREYNEKATKKVHVLGIDSRASGPLFSFMDYYTATLGSEKSNKYLYEIAKSNIQQVISFSKNDTLLQNKLGPVNYKLLIYFLSDRSFKIPANSYFNRENRDSTMFIRTLGLDSLLLETGDKIATLAHSAHLQKTNLIRADSVVKPLGSYLSDKYRDAYYAINFNIGGGTYVQDSCRSITLLIDTLKSIPKHSFEYAALQVPYEKFFCTTKNFRNRMHSMAYVNRYSQHKNHFTFASLERRFDAIVFQKRSVAFSDFEVNPWLYQFKFEHEKRRKYREIFRRINLKK